MDATEIGICIGDNLMRKLSSEAEKIMIERFGKDTVIALATVEQEMPYVRNVNAYYEDCLLYTSYFGCFGRLFMVSRSVCVKMMLFWKSGSM